MKVKSMTSRVKKNTLQSVKINRVVYVPQTIEENQKPPALKKIAQTEETTLHDILDEAIDDLFAKRGLNSQGQPNRSLLSFEETKPKKPQTCCFHKCKNPVTYQAQTPEGKLGGLCKEHAQTIHKPSPVSIKSRGYWKSLTHIDSPNQSLCSMCVEVSLHTLLSLPSNRQVPLCAKHYWEVQESRAAGNKNWRELTNQEKQNNESDK
jgi:hypothetical protein